MSFLPILGGVFNSLITGWQNRQMMDDYYQNEAYKAQYNSIGNQLQQWKNAGLNPINFHGNFQPVTGTPPQPRSVGDSLSQSLSTTGTLWQQKQLAKMNYDVQMSKLELDKQQLQIALDDAKLRKEMHNWNTKLAEQSFNRGDYALAMDILDYTYAFSTHDKRVQQFKDEAAITSEYAKRYPSYLSAMIDNYLQRNASLRHSRKIADQRLVLDWNKHYDDVNYNYFRSAQDDIQFNKSFGLRKSQQEENVRYHDMYLDYLYLRRDDAFRRRDFQQAFEFTKMIQSQSGFKVPKFSPKIIY